MALTGLSAFPITPAGPDGRVDLAALRRLLAPLVAAGVDSIGLLGSTGTYAYLAREERRRALEVAVEAAAGRTPILVGVGALRTDEAVGLAQDAKAIGAAAGLLAPVSYTPLTDDEVFAHFVAVGRHSDLPLCIYDNPSTTHFRFDPDLVRRLSRTSEVIAMKSAAPDPAAAADHVYAQRAMVPQGFSLGYSADWYAVEALLAGGDAWYGVAAGLFPDICVAIVRAVQRGDADDARRLNGTLQPLWALFQEFSSLRVMYAAAESLGICAAEPPRPILPLSKAAKERVAGVVAGIRVS